MNWLPWLKAAERDLLRKRIQDVALAEIYKRHWGAAAKGSSPGGIPRIYIMDIRGLFLALGVLRYTLGELNSKLLYRGQRKDWELQPSLFRGAKNKAQAMDRVAWLTSALAAIAPVFTPRGTPEQREALAQHYGLPTRWLDAVDSVQTAAWFAHHGGDSTLGKGELDDAVGYISAIAVPATGPKYATAVDLRSYAAEWLRPHIQQAWAFRAENQNVGLGRVSYLQVATFIVPRPLLANWAGYSTLTPNVMFPNENEDKGAYYWRKAEGELVRKALLPPRWTKP